VKNRMKKKGTNTKKKSATKAPELGFDPRTPSLEG
jgi:hypothetical protein